MNKHIFGSVVAAILDKFVTIMGASEPDVWDGRSTFLQVKEENDRVFLATIGNNDASLSMGVAS